MNISEFNKWQTSLTPRQKNAEVVGKAAAMLVMGGSLGERNRNGSKPW